MNKDRIEFQSELHIESENLAESLEAKKIAKELDLAKIKIGALFDERKNYEKRDSRWAVRKILERFKKDLKNIFEEKKIRKIEVLLRGCRNITDREEFISRVSLLYLPLIQFKVKNPVEWQQNERNNMKGERLSEVLFYGTKSIKHGQEKTVYIHLAPSSTLGIKKIKESVDEGLKKLAEVINNDPEIKRIGAVSWILGKNPDLVKDMVGFKDSRIIGEDEKIKRHLDLTKPIGEAFITREEFLEKHLK